MHSYGFRKESDKRFDSSSYFRLVEVAPVFGDPVWRWER